MAPLSADLRDLPRRHDYAPGKNSFIVQGFGRGERRVLLDVAGCGSVRHVWATWYRSFERETGVEPGQVLLRVFVDAEAAPSVEGTIDALCAAEETNAVPGADQTVLIWQGSYNLYRPIFFGMRVRLEAEALSDLDEFYAQVDYRITPRPESRACDTVEEPEPRPHSEPLALAPGAQAEVVIEGPATIRSLSFMGEAVEDLDLTIHWDDQTLPAVVAPLRYLFGGFRTLLLDAAPTRLTSRFPMPFRRRARIRLANPTSAPRSVEVRYVAEHGPADDDLRQFHAAFAESQGTSGYEDVHLLDVRGEGHFVGITLFDSGHNHGGGDTALTDAETDTPRVLHGICGEDYFSFAWHKTGAVHAFAGAPVHERRFRFHLENPYPFRRSLSFRFGCFAGLHPKGVAFWYQNPEPPPAGPWLAPTVRWMVFGPVARDDELPQAVDHESRETEVALAHPERFTLRWEEVTMARGFLDLTHHFRRFFMASAGTGFVVGASRTKAVTWIHSPGERSVEALLGHDDPVRVSLNAEPEVTLSGTTGFGASPLTLLLRAGWNELALVIENAENVNWRWLGVSLALRTEGGLLDGVRFSSASHVAGRGFESRPPRHS